MKLPAFKFKNTEAITNTYLADKLSKHALGILEDEGLMVYDSFAEVLDAINRKIQEQNKTVVNKQAKGPRTVSIGGTSLRVPDQDGIYDIDYEILGRCF